MSTLLISRMGTILITALFLPVTVTEPQERQTESKYPCPPDTPIESGETMYRIYCAVCHGIDGKGGGPVTPALRDQVPDLTTLSQSHGGKYPTHYVENIIRFGTEKDYPAHGNKDMPIWGALFASMPKSDKRTVTRTITDLTQYLGTLQAK